MRISFTRFVGKILGDLGTAFTVPITVRFGLGSLFPSASHWLMKQFSDQALDTSHPRPMPGPFPR
jgi:hypothetical protein